MEDCVLRKEKNCRKTSSKVDIRYFWGRLLALGNVTDISKSCMCITTRFCLPLHSRIELFLTLNKKVLDFPVRINKFCHRNSLHDTMTVEVLNPPEEYFNLVESCTPAL